MGLGPNTRYNANIFGVKPHAKEVTIMTDTGIIPEAHKNYMVYNVGRTEVYAKLKYGTKVMWHGVADETSVAPGETKILNNWGRPYYVTGVKIYNNTDTRAVVHCATYDDKYFLYANKEPGSFDEVRNKILKSVFSLGLKYVPVVGSALSGLVSAFWPDNKPSAWEQVQDKVKEIVDQKILEAISGILSGDMRQYQERITVLSQEIDNGGNPEDLRVHYMNIAQDLIGFEKKFIFPSDIPDYQNVNQYILPHYSTTVLMKTSFYVIGITQAERIGLTHDNIEEIKSYADRTINDQNGANNYINALYKDRVDNAYAKIFAEDLFDNMMNVRSFIGTQGLEYIRIWNYMLKNLSGEGVYNDVISYSTLFGRHTPKVIKEATPEELTEPLTPRLIDGKRNILTSVDVYIWRINNGNGPARVGGMQLTFESGDMYKMGTESSEVHKVDFKGALLTKLEVFGGGAIDFLAFYFNDDRIDTVGEKSSQDNTVFELKDHHIVSIFVSSDNWSLAGQAANICVSYKLNENAGK